MRRVRAYSSSVRRSSWSISIHFIAVHSFAAKNRQKIMKTPYFGGSRSFKVINVNIPKKLVISACYVKSMSVSICNHFHIRQAIS